MRIGRQHGREVIGEPGPGTRGTRKEGADWIFTVGIVYFLRFLHPYINRPLKTTEMRILKAKIVLPILLAGVLFATASPAQQSVRTIYRPWRLFWGDTSAYMEANWGRNTSPVYPEGRPLKEFFKEFEIPITAVRFRLYDRVICAMSLYIIPYEQLMALPQEQRREYAIRVQVPLDYAFVAAKYEEQIPELKNRNRNETVSIFLPWKPSYAEILGDISYVYVVD